MDNRQSEFVDNGVPAAGLRCKGYEQMLCVRGQMLIRAVLGSVLVEKAQDSVEINTKGLFIKAVGPVSLWL